MGLFCAFYSLCVYLRDGSCTNKCLARRTHRKSPWVELTSRRFINFFLSLSRLSFGGDAFRIFFALCPRIVNGDCSLSCLCTSWVLITGDNALIVSHTLHRVRCAILSHKNIYTSAAVRAGCESTHAVNICLGCGRALKYMQLVALESHQKWNYLIKCEFL